MQLTEQSGVAGVADDDDVSSTVLASDAAITGWSGAAIGAAVFFLANLVALLLPGALPWQQEAVTLPPQ